MQVWIFIKLENDLFLISVKKEFIAKDLSVTDIKIRLEK